MLLRGSQAHETPGHRPPYLRTKMAVGLTQGRFALFWDAFSEPDAETRFNFKKLRVGNLEGKAGEGCLSPGWAQALGGPGRSCPCRTC